MAFYNFEPNSDLEEVDLVTQAHQQKYAIKKKRGTQMYFYIHIYHKITRS